MPPVKEPPRYSYRRSADQDARAPVRHPLVVVGGGPVGLVAALDAATRGLPVVVLDDNDTVSTGSRSICWSKRTLEILDRLGCGQRLVERGITWSRGKVFFRDRLVYSFDLLPEPDHRRPAFVNLQQSLVEEMLVEQAGELQGVDLRWRHRVSAVEPGADAVALTVDTPDGPYRLEAEWLIAADGAGSTVAAALGLESRGQAFQDRFLIADVHMQAEFPIERWFWFDPPFHQGQSALLHRQADDVWRIDFQLGPQADPEEEKRPERVLPRIRAMLGPGIDFELVWASVYNFRCSRLERFRHGRVLFAGDAAHLVSPFGARGANGGIQDVDNLGWKLEWVISGRAPESLLDSYDEERVPAADENILNSTRSTDFITPKNAMSRAFRDAALTLAREYPFARALVNSGRLSRPAVYLGSSLNTQDCEPFTGGVLPGAPCIDAPVARVGEKGNTAAEWLLGRLGSGFTGLLFWPEFEGARSAAAASLTALEREQPGLPILVIVTDERHAGGLPAGAPVLVDPRGRVRERYGGEPGTFYLMRPDQHVAGRWRGLDAERVRTALLRATAQVV